MNANTVFAILWTKMKQMSLNGGGKLQLTSNVQCGAINPNTKVNNTALELWEMALIKKLALDVKITPSLSASQIYEKGVPINPTLNISVNKKPNGGSDIVSITYSSTPNDPIFVAQPVTSVTSYSDSVSTTFSDTQVYSVSALDVNGLTGRDTVTFTFVYPMYMSLIDPADIGNITETVIKNSGNKVIATKSTQNYTLNSGAGNYKYPLFCYPSSYGNITRILDVNNGFDLTNNYTQGSITMSCADGTNQQYTYYVANIYNAFMNFQIEFNF